MKKIVLLLSLITSITFVNSDEYHLQQKTKSNFFIQNKEQWPKEVKFLAKIGVMNAWITDFGVVYEYYKIKRDYSKKDLLKMSEHEKEKYKKKHTTITEQVVKTTFVGKNINTTYNGKDKKQTYYNYLMGKDKSKFASYVPLYGEVEVKEIYNGIDIRYYYDKDILRYDFTIKPGANLSQINMSLEGADNYSVNKKGELEIETSLGVVKHKDILSYQKDVTGKYEIVKTSFTKKENGTIGFRVENYDKDKELIIDPLVYSTFIGGNNWDEGGGITIDDSGKVYITGYTNSTDYPTTSGAFNESLNVGNNDVFITKLNASGNDLVYSTFIGGNSDDIGSGIVLDNSGNVYVTGYTTSTDYPTTSGSYDESYNSGGDVFITKLNPSGSDLVYSTFIGGSSYEGEGGIALDNSGNVYITGYTNSTDYPTTSGAFDESFNGGNNDVFITKLNASGSDLVYSTFIGGSSYDGGVGIALDNSGYVYVTGYTNSTDYPTTSGSYDESYNSGGDVFITKLNASGSDLVYSTFIGGNSTEGGGYIALDNSGNVYVSGYTTSTDFPATSGAFDENYNGVGNGFITKLNASGNGLVYSTFISGENWVQIKGIALDNSGNVYITGYTNSTDYPTTSGAFDESFNGVHDVFLTKLNVSGSALVYSTFIGGSNDDVGYGLTLDNSGNVYITGYTRSTDYPTTSDAFDESLNGWTSVFVMKLEVMGVGDNGIGLQGEYFLEQNYPNPFNTETTLKVEMSKQSFVTLKVYDVLGREVRTLVNKEMKAGSYKVDFNSKGLASGVYFYRLTAGSFNQIKKMVLIK